jgi:hypothetical protein
MPVPTDSLRQSRPRLAIVRARHLNLWRTDMTRSRCLILVVVLVAVALLVASPALAGGRDTGKKWGTIHNWG